MNSTTPPKITPSHLDRDAYVYVRRATRSQNGDQHQYALRECAIGLGWRPDQVVVLDCDIGMSGALGEDRPGLRRLVRDVGLGRVGVVLCLDLCRLTRSPAYCQRLLDSCTRSDTLVLVGDRLYDPARLNHCLELGIRVAMSETELHQCRRLPRTDPLTGPPDPSLPVRRLLSDTQPTPIRTGVPTVVGGAGAAR